MPRKLSPIHPGEVLKSVLEDAGLNANRAALELHVPANRISDILRGKRPITADTALRLARFFGTSAGMWINLQAKYDLQMAEDRLAEKVAEEVRPFKAA
jgi:addiction module HigA family antidote